MVMSMDMSDDQTMSSPPLPANEDSVSPSAALNSPSPFRQQGSADDEHEDEHSKGSNQTVVASQQQQQQKQWDRAISRNDHIQGSAASPATLDNKKLVSRLDDDQQEHMIVSRGSSFDGDRKLPMHVDDESNDESSMSASLKFQAVPLESSSRLSQISRANKGSGAPAARPTELSTKMVESSLVAQMRDIVEGGTSLAVATQKSHQHPHPHSDQDKQPKSSSDSLNNQNENNSASKASLDSASAQKRARHPRGHCRHHHNHHHHHHHHHRHRQSVGGASSTGVQTAALSETGPTDVGQVDPANPSSNQHSQQYQHHHRNSNAGHAHPHHHHNHHHHHSGHHHHHHHHHPHDKTKSASSKRNSIQRLALSESGSNQQQQQQQAKNESNSSMSSLSMSKQGQQAGAQNQSNPDSKSSRTPSDELNLDHENQQDPSSQPTNRDGGHHHHHHHHCHHRSHKKRLVLDAGNNQPAAVAKPEESPTSGGGSQPRDSRAECGAPRRKPLQDSTSGMNVVESDEQDRPKCHHHHHQHHSHTHEHGHHHHHHQHHHHAHAHTHPHHHHQHSHSIHCAAAAAGAADGQQGGSNKDLNDPSQQAATTAAAEPQPHNHRHHRHHHHHGHHHHCRHARHRNRQRSGSKANVSPKDSAKNLDALGRTVEEHEGASRRRCSSHSAAANSKPDNDDQVVAMKDGHEGEAENDGAKELAGAGNDEIVSMEVSPKMSERKASQVVMSDGNDPTGVAEVVTSTGANVTVQSVVAGQEVAEARESEVGGTSGHKHDSSCQNFDQIRRSDQENAHSMGPAGSGQEGHNRLSRQISSQSSKKSQKDGIQGAGQNQQDQRLNECAEPGLRGAGANQQSAIKQRQIIESSVPADRRCRFCWCCCCPCSVLSVRENPDRAVDKAKPTSGPPSSPTSKYPSAPDVSLDEIRAWGESFDKLMKCKDGRKVFQDFLRCEYSEENILFWSACEELKKERDSKSVAAKARDIYEDYISILSSKEVSLDSRVRDVINNNIKKPTSNIFDEAQLQIYTLMHRDSYPRFINSGMYKKLAQITTSNSRKSST